MKLVRVLAVASMMMAQAALAQSVPALVARGDSLNAAFDVVAALQSYQRALDVDSVAFPALWKASRAAMDLAEFQPDEKRRGELFDLGEAYARRALAANPTDAEGHFAVARALGMAALTVGVRERVKHAVEIREQALAALAGNPKHGGALHVMGSWNAEVKRLNVFERVIAQNFLGGGTMSNASWADATRYLEAAVAEEPLRIVHHLDLARIYADTDERAKAREEYGRVLALPRGDLNDPEYKKQAESELAKLGG